MSLECYETDTEVLGRLVSARVYYRYYPGSAGRKDGGVPIEPDEAPFVEIDHIMLKFGDVWVEADASFAHYEDFSERIYNYYH